MSANLPNFPSPPKGRVVTPELLERMVRAVEYYKFDNDTTMACALKLINGFTVVGLSSCIPTTIFDAGIGERYARQDAENRLAVLVGFMACDILANHPARWAIDAQIQILKG